MRTTCGRWEPALKELTARAERTCCGLVLPEVATVDMDFARTRAIALQRRCCCQFVDSIADAMVDVA